MHIYITKQAEKQLDKLPDPLAKNITQHLLRLSTDPYPTNSKKLTGQNIYRLRIGSFRVLYSIDISKKEITVLRVADRKTVYR